MGCVHSRERGPNVYKVTCIESDKDLATSECHSSEDETGKQVNDEQCVRRSGKSRSMELPAEHRKKLAFLVPASPKSLGRTASLELGRAGYMGAHMGAPMPANEPERLAFVRALGVLDTPEDESINSIIKLVASIFQVKSAVVSIVDKDRVWFKAKIGVEQTEIPRRTSLAAWSLLYKTPTVIVVEDTLEDARFREHPMVVGPPGLRFYAGAPLTASNGLRLGSMCIADTKPRQLDAEACGMLVKFASMITKELEKTLLIVKQRSDSFLEAAQSAGLLARLDSYADAIVFIDTTVPRWQILFVNDACTKLLGVNRGDLVNAKVWDQFVVTPSSKATSWTSCADCVQAGLEFVLSASPVKSTAGKAFEMVFRPANAHDERAHHIANVPSFVHALMDEATMTQYYFVVVQNKHAPSTQLLSSQSIRCFTPKKQPFEDVKLGPLMGQGSFGRVFRGMWNGALVAVKIIQHTRNELIAQADMPRSDVSGLFEAVLSADLSHPNVVQTFKWATRPAKRASAETSSSLSPRKLADPPASDCATRDEELDEEPLLETWLVLEFCDRGSLLDAIYRGVFRSQGSQQDGSANMMRILATAHEIAAGLAFLHSMDILHGDLSAGNILLAGSNKDDRRFVAKIADFGLSRIVSGSDVVNTHTYGTVTHMPPELLVTGSLSKKADVYAFGVLLFEMYTAQTPWCGLRHGQIVEKVAMERKQLEFPSGTPKPYVDLANSCMAFEPAQRPKFEDILESVENMQQQMREAPASMASMGFPVHLL